MATPQASFYILKIYMPGTKIYRTLRAPGHVSLHALHQAIHKWMEFPTEEMYGFFLDNKLLSDQGYYAQQMRKKHSASDVTLDMLNLKKDQRFLYVYDMSELLQFYIRVEDIRPADRMSPDYIEIELLRQNGHLDLDRPQETEADESAFYDTSLYQNRADLVSMADCIRHNETDQILWTCQCMNLPAQKYTKALADEMVNTLKADETMVLRMMPEYMIKMLGDIWSQDTLSVPEQGLTFLSLLGFLYVDHSGDPGQIVWSWEARNWFSAILSRYETRHLRAEYNQWSMCCKGLLVSYGVIPMDDFLMFFNRLTGRQANAKDVCDFIMQRLEWYVECYAIEVGTKMYFSLPEETRAVRILRERAQYPLPYKRLTKKEIYENAESAGWSHVDCGQELFDALQGIAVPDLDLNEVLNEIVECFTRGLEPREIMDSCLPPVSLIGKAAYKKIHYCLEKVHRQLPDYALMGFTIDEIEKRDPQYKNKEGFTIIKGNGGRS